MIQEINNDKGKGKKVLEEKIKSVKIYIMEYRNEKERREREGEKERERKRDRERER